MYIRSVTVENVKSFRKKHRFELTSGVNYFVGDNNSGKSTVLEALLFMFEGPSASKWTPDKFYCADATGPTRVEVDIADDVDGLVKQEKFAVLKDFVFDDGGKRVLRLERSSESRTVVQGGKDKKIDVKAVCFWHPARQQFENVMGIDARVKAIFDFEAVWADAQPADHIDFANTKTLGRLLDSSFKRFVETPLWKALAAAHEKAFSPGEGDSFLAETAKLADGIKQLVDEQYGEASYRFDFGLPDAAVFMKQGSLHVDDGAGETPVDGKGTGMQRAIALGIIQFYARSAALIDESITTPLVLMLDEPETWLHPSAQLKLGDAVSRIGEREQVFIITHSPYLIRKFNPKTHLLTVLAGQGAERRIDRSTAFGLFGVGEPTWGEINYRAFGVCSNDFHNELYGHVQRHIEAQNADGRFAREDEVDAYLEGEGIPKAKTWIRNASLSYQTTLPVYVRNAIHHPENSANAPVTNDELHESIEHLVSVVEKINSIPNPSP
ncbi:AAA family ATPase [Mycolicibacterium neoaurum]|uniref:ATP-dependent nuclease n=1 Tax=Mycolicibacterium neoaurum TaxID=1795 RepID=UPI00248C220F|nr:AAA family ATPase [Mycolicibacterium neoaurum]WBP95690.1 AAA family ATPase [Mycolicibacterium neoaurum]WBS09372.1 AAA family ATPase [Mycolicibacterium neoaurum]